jgi:hypothetical protein
MAATPAGDTRVRRRVTTIIKPDGATAVAAYSASKPDIKWCDKHYIAVVRFGVVTSGIFSVRAKPVIEPAMTNTSPSRSAMIGIETIDFTKINNMAWEVSGFFDAFELAITTVIGGGGSIAIVINSVDTNG